jgi:hypothetical protein
VEPFHFVSWCLAITVTVALLWPVNLLFMALAFKVRHGTRRMDMEPAELWWRSTLASLGLAIISLIFVGLNYVLVWVIEMPQGPMQTILLLCYLPAAIAFIWWSLALEDLLDGTGIFLLYVLLPGLPLLLAGRMFGLWRAIEQAAPWFLPST